MKKIKVLPAFMAATLLAGSAVPFISYAEYNDLYADNLLKKAISSIDETPLTFSACGGEYGDYTSVITQDDIYFLCPSYTNEQIIRFKKNTEILLEDINEKLAPDYMLIQRDKDDCSYNLMNTNNNLTGMTDKQAQEIVLQYGSVLTIAENYKILDYKSSWNIDGIEITSDLSPEKIIEKYPELSLVQSETSSEEYTYKFIFDDFVISDINLTDANLDFINNYLENNQNLSDEELKYFKLLDFNVYETAKNISQDTDIKDWNFTGSFQQADMMDKFDTFLSGEEYSYIAEITGDTNIDGEVNIADSVAVTAYVSNKEKNPMEEQSALNGDVFNTGDGLNASDAFKIQQYATGVINEL